MGSGITWGIDGMETWSDEVLCGVHASLSEEIRFRGIQEPPPSTPVESPSSAVEMPSVAEDRAKRLKWCLDAIELLFKRYPDIASTMFTIVSLIESPRKVAPQ